MNPLSVSCRDANCSVVDVVVPESNEIRASMILSRRLGISRDAPALACNIAMRQPMFRL